MINAQYGYIVRVVTKASQDCWLGQRVYMAHDSAITVKHNCQDSRRYSRVYILPATKEQMDSALSVSDYSMYDLPANQSDLGGGNNPV